MTFSTAYEWLNWIKSLHGSEIDLGLERVRGVAQHLNLLPLNTCVISVAGTNGKGSCVATLEAIYLASGIKVGTFTSPMLFKANEQIKITGREVSDQELCRAFSAVAENLRGISVTPFEFFTLAALVIFKSQANLDLVILEVGLGGRLDAVNIVDADLAVVTSIDLDHMAYLGNNRDSIGYEKAGIFRPNKLAVCGDAHPPKTVLQHAENLSVPLLVQEKNFGFVDNEKTWEWSDHIETMSDLPKNGLLLQNLATSLMVIKLLQPLLAVKQEAIIAGLSQVKLSGRIEVLPAPITTIYDVAHNPAAVAKLAGYLADHPIGGKTIGVFSMLADKDMVETIKRIHQHIDTWYVAPLKTERGASIEKLKGAFIRANITNAIEYFSSVQTAFAVARKHATEGERMVIFGSFHTVACVRRSSSVL